MTEEIPQDIKTTKVDFDFSDPNIRGASGSVMAAGTDADRAEFVRNMEAGMSRKDAVQNMAITVARRSQQVIGTASEYDSGSRPTVRGAVDRIARISRSVIRRTRASDVKTVTIMCKLSNCEHIFQQPLAVLDYEGPWVYSSLSVGGGASPLHYWTGAYAVTEDFWTKEDLDGYATFHGVSAVVALELEPEDADTFIAEIRRNAIDRSPTKSMHDDA